MVALMLLPRVYGSARSEGGLFCESFPLAGMAASLAGPCMRGGIGCTRTQALKPDREKDFYSLHGSCPTTKVLPHPWTAVPQEAA